MDKASNSKDTAVFNGARLSFLVKMVSHQEAIERLRLKRPTFWQKNIPEAVYWGTYDSYMYGTNLPLPLGSFGNIQFPKNLLDSKRQNWIFGVSMCNTDFDEASVSTRGLATWWHYQAIKDGLSLKLISTLGLYGNRYKNLGYSEYCWATDPESVRFYAVLWAESLITKYQVVRVQVDSVLHTLDYGDYDLRYKLDELMPKILEFGVEPVFIRCV